MSKIKDKMYYYMVKKNKDVQYEYERYVIENMIEHYKNRFKHWKILLKLNWHYRIKKSTKRLLFEDKGSEGTGVGLTLDKVEHSSKKQPLPMRGVKAESSLKTQSSPIREAKAESSLKTRPLPIREAKVYAKYEYVSFDIFDTLLFRPFSKPSDLFMLVGEKLDIMEFTVIRITAEEEARKEHQLLFGNREVTIYDIYEKISYKTGLDVNLGVNTEYEVEYDLCFANPYMKRIYDLLVGMDKKIIFVSDMYYSQEMLKKILDKNGYTHYEKIFVSCEYNCSKANKGLFRYVLDYVNGQSIIHVGDNVKSDYEIPTEMGIRSVHYQNVNERGKTYRSKEMTYLVGSAYSGIINSVIHNGIKEYSPYYEYGFIYAGIYILGYCNWVHNYAKTHSIDKILFLSRDGDIYYQVYTLLYNDIKAEYAYWSRIPNLKLEADKNRYAYVKALINDKARDLYKTKIAVLLQEAQIECLLSYLNEYRLHEDEFITEDNEKMIERLMIEHWDEIVHSYDILDFEMKEYYSGIIKGCKKIAVVDVGWSGNIVLGLKKMIVNKWKLPCEVDCLLAAMRGIKETSLETLELKKSVGVYMFSTIDNYDIHVRHMGTNKRLNSFLFEMMTQSNSATFTGIQDGKFQFEIPETENFEHNNEIHRGIKDFAVLYTTTFKNYDYLLNIPGRDAYMPFYKLVQDLTFVKKYFGDYVFGRGVLSTAGEDGKETVAEVLKNAGL